VYPRSVVHVVDRIVTRIHGKGDQAGRSGWTAVARARHNRDANHKPEPGLDLLERYLAEGRNVTMHQKEEWAADYPVTVLDDAMKRVALRLGAASAPDLAKRYPMIQGREALETILRGIGRREIGFAHVRSATFGDDYGLPLAPAPVPGAGGANQGGGAVAVPAGQPSKEASGEASVPAASPAADQATNQAAATRKPPARATNDPRAVKQALRRFTPRGFNREKLATLLNEAKSLDIVKTPNAFCFLLRSMFEISAKAYCTDHAPSGLATVKADGSDRKLKDILSDIADHLTRGNKDKAMVKELTGAKTELGRADSILSVTSLNQLVHNPSYTITGDHISTVFMNVFPLLRAMSS
jgi:hypothetical protein